MTTSKPLATKSIPRWLEVKAEADYWHWVITTMYEKSGKRSPLDKMIDSSTGHEEALLKEAKDAISQFERCRKELTKFTDLPTERPDTTNGQTEAQSGALGRVFG